MLIQFQVIYKTHIGQQLVIVGSIPELGNGRRQDAPLMTLKDVITGLWIFQVELSSLTDFSYRYFVKDDNFNTFIEEWGPDRVFKSEERLKKTILLSDCWRPMSDPDYALYSSAFVNAILKPGDTLKAPKVKAGTTPDTVILKFKPNVIRIKPGHKVAVAGSAKNLGAWKEKKAISLGNPDHPQWSGEVVVNISEFPIHYKYLIQNEEGKIAFWEKSFDRIISLPEGIVPDVIEIGDDKFDFPQYPWKGAGVAIPVFSLRRATGFGVGEFTDIKLLVDWAVETGLKLIQILPVNDTVAKHTWMDSYPYAAISVYALHPIYINLSEIGKLDSEINQQIIEAQGNYLNSLVKIDYEAVMALKSRFFKLIYDQKKNDFLKGPDFLEFFNENKYWLKPYSAFSYLRDLFNTPDFSRWGEYSSPTNDLLTHLTDPNSAHYDDIAVHYFIQYHAHCQLLDAAKYARSKGIVLKGDIPIGIYRNSADAWLNPHLFHLDCQAGAPPDDFSVKGQNWRFPTYNWEEMAKDNYTWWQQRLNHLSRYFDAFRIDHILGFFRIWEIPASQVEGLMGYFNPSIPYFRDELQNRGLWFDENRLCKPYIREHFLYERFGDQTDFVKANYLVESGYQCYDLHPDYDTQRKVEEKLIIEPDATPEMRSRTELIIQGLYSLISEVLFLPAPGMGGNAFFPRNTLHFTRSYQELDNHAKYVINEIYLDYFYQRNEEFWRGKAMEKLPVLKKATNMLLCGEDLGMVPACVPNVMNDLGILSLEVQRMPKDPKITFGHPANYPYLSVATPSSHDTSTVRGWWEENYAQSQQFYNEILGNSFEAPYFCEPFIVQQIIVQHLYSPSMWTIFAIQDLLGMDVNLRLENANAERINNPGNPNHYWRYRMHLNLEDLLVQTEFNQLIRDQISSSGRLEIY
ncbi:MAG: 4-alpha-glucanotransferase [Lentimicrobiaceae bacterium]|jgi:4-alpha-glucanotransferase